MYDIACGVWLLVLYGNYGLICGVGGWYGFSVSLYIVNFVYRLQVGQFRKSSRVVFGSSPNLVSLMLQIRVECDQMFVD